MKLFLKTKRNNSLKSKKLGKYLLYAIGEVVLIIFGILIAVRVNENLVSQKHKEIRCIYLEELKSTFEYDVKDVEENLLAFSMWNPKIVEIVKTIHAKKPLSEIDSLHDKLGTVGNYIFFGQRSKTKIEELKYSNIHLIENRELKNRILLYQDDKIMFIRNNEKTYNLLSEDIRHYYTKNFTGYNYGKAIPHNLENLQNDREYFSLITQRLRKNNRFKSLYENLQQEQKEIKQLIDKEIERNCN